jgi:hypothetical protein
MQAALKELQGALGKWDALLAKRKITADEVDKLNEAGLKVQKRAVSAVMDRDCKGPSCRFGCPAPK